MKQYLKRMKCLTCVTSLLMAAFAIFSLLSAFYIMIENRSFDMRSGMLLAMAAAAFGGALAVGSCHKCKINSVPGHKE